MAAQGFELGGAVGVIGLGDVEVIAPAGEFRAIVAKRLDFREEGFQWKVGPLAGEQGYRSHGDQSVLEVG